MFSQELREHIKEVADFPKEGVSFKDISPLLLNPKLSRKVVQVFSEHAKRLQADYIAGIDARGFLFGTSVAQEANIGFIPVRKKGKLPRPTLEVNYQLEYGEACVAIHKDDIVKGASYLIHDDLLATGGTAVAAAEAIEKAGGKVLGFQFLIELDFLKGKSALGSEEVFSLIHY